MSLVSVVLIWLPLIIIIFPKICHLCYVPKSSTCCATVRLFSPELCPIKNTTKIGPLVPLIALRKNESSTKRPQYDADVTNFEHPSTQHTTPMEQRKTVQLSDEEPYLKETDRYIKPKSAKKQFVTDILKIKERIDVIPKSNVHQLRVFNSFPKRDMPLGTPYLDNTPMYNYDIKPLPAVPSMPIYILANPLFGMNLINSIPPQYPLRYYPNRIRWLRARNAYNRAAHLLNKEIKFNTPPRHYSLGYHRKPISSRILADPWINTKTGNEIPRARHSVRYQTQSMRVVPATSRHFLTDQMFNTETIRQVPFSDYSIPRELKYSLINPVAATSEDLPIPSTAIYLKFPNVLKHNIYESPYYLIVPATSGSAESYLKNSAENPITNVLGKSNIQNDAIDSSIIPPIKTIAIPFPAFVEMSNIKKNKHYHGGEISSEPIPLKKLDDTSHIPSNLKTSNTDRNKIYQKDDNTYTQLPVLEDLNYPLLSESPSLSTTYENTKHQAARNISVGDQLLEIVDSNDNGNSLKGKSMFVSSTPTLSIENDGITSTKLNKFYGSVHDSSIVSPKNKIDHDFSLLSSSPGSENPENVQRNGYQKFESTNTLKSSKQYKPDGVVSSVLPTAKALLTDDLLDSNAYNTWNILDKQKEARINELTQTKLKDENPVNILSNTDTGSYQKFSVKLPNVNPEGNSQERKASNRLNVNKPDDSSNLFVKNVYDSSVFPVSEQNTDKNRLYKISKLKYPNQVNDGVSQPTYKQLYKINQQNIYPTDDKLEPSGEIKRDAFNKLDGVFVLSSPSLQLELKPPKTDQTHEAPNRQKSAEQNKLNRLLFDSLMFPSDSSYFDIQNSKEMYDMNRRKYQIPNQSRIKYHSVVNSLPNNETSTYQISNVDTREDRSKRRVSHTTNPDQSKKLDGLLFDGTIAPSTNMQYISPDIGKHQSEQAYNPLQKHHGYESSFLPMSNTNRNTYPLKRLNRQYESPLLPISKTLSENRFSHPNSQRAQENFNLSRDKFKRFGLNKLDDLSVLPTSNTININDLLSLKNQDTNYLQNIYPTNEASEVLKEKKLNKLEKHLLASLVLPTSMATTVKKYPKTYNPWNILNLKKENKDTSNVVKSSAQDIVSHQMPNVNTGNPPTYLKSSNINDHDLLYKIPNLNQKNGVRSTNEQLSKFLQQDNHQRYKVFEKNIYDTPNNESPPSLFSILEASKLDQQQIQKNKVIEALSPTQKKAIPNDALDSDDYYLRQIFGVNREMEKIPNYLMNGKVKNHTSNDIVPHRISTSNIQDEISNKFNRNRSKKQLNGLLVDASAIPPIITNLDRRSHPSDNAFVIPNNKFVRDLSNSLSQLKIPGFNNQADGAIRQPTNQNVFNNIQHNSYLNKIEPYQKDININNKVEFDSSNHKNIDSVIEKLNGLNTVVYHTEDGANRIKPSRKNDEHSFAFSVLPASKAVIKEYPKKHNSWKILDTQRPEKETSSKPKQNTPNISSGINSLPSDVVHPILYANAQNDLEEEKIFDKYKQDQLTNLLNNRLRVQQSNIHNIRKPFDKNEYDSSKISVANSKINDNLSSLLSQQKIPSISSPDDGFMSIPAYQGINQNDLYSLAVKLPEVNQKKVYLTDQAPNINKPVESNKFNKVFFDSIVLPTSKTIMRDDLSYPGTKLLNTFGINRGMEKLSNGLIQSTHNQYSVLNSVPDYDLTSPTISVVNTQDNGKTPKTSKIINKDHLKKLHNTLVIPSTNFEVPNLNNQKGEDQPYHEVEFESLILPTTQSKTMDDLSYQTSKFKLKLPEVSKENTYTGIDRLQPKVQSKMYDFMSLNLPRELEGKQTTKEQDSTGLNKVYEDSFSTSAFPASNVPNSWKVFDANRQNKEMFNKPIKYNFKNYAQVDSTAKNDVLSHQISKDKRYYDSQIYKVSNRLNDDKLVDSLVIPSKDIYKKQQYRPIIKLFDQNVHDSSILPISNTNVNDDLYYSHDTGPINQPTIEELYKIFLQKGNSTKGRLKENHFSTSGDAAYDTLLLPTSKTLLINGLSAPSPLLVEETPAIIQQIVIPDANKLRQNGFYKPNGTEYDLSKLPINRKMLDELLSKLALTSSKGIPDPNVYQVKGKLKRNSYHTLGDSPVLPTSKTIIMNGLLPQSSSFALKTPKIVRHNDHTAEETPVSNGVYKPDSAEYVFPTMPSDKVILKDLLSTVQSKSLKGIQRQNVYQTQDELTQNNYDTLGGVVYNSPVLPTTKTIVMNALLPQSSSFDLKIPKIVRHNDYTAEETPMSNGVYKPESAEYVFPTMSSNKVILNDVLSKVPSKSQQGIQRQNVYQPQDELTQNNYDTLGGVVYNSPVLPTTTKIVMNGFLPQSLSFDLKNPKIIRHNDYTAEDIAKPNESFKPNGAEYDFSISPPNKIKRQNVYQTDSKLKPNNYYTLGGALSDSIVLPTSKTIILNDMSSPSSLVDLKTPGIIQQFVVPADEKLKQNGLDKLDGAEFELSMLPSNRIISKDLLPGDKVKSTDTNGQLKRNNFKTEGGSLYDTLVSSTPKTKILNSFLYPSYTFDMETPKIFKQKIYSTDDEIKSNRIRKPNDFDLKSPESGQQNINQVEKASSILKPNKTLFDIMPTTLNTIDINKQETEIFKQPIKSRFEKDASNSVKDLNDNIQKNHQEIFDKTKRDQFNILPNKKFISRGIHKYQNKKAKKSTTNYLDDNLYDASNFPISNTKTDKGIVNRLPPLKVLNRNSQTYDTISQPTKEQLIKIYQILNDYSIDPTLKLKIIKELYYTPKISPSIPVHPQVQHLIPGKIPTLTHNPMLAPWVNKFGNNLSPLDRLPIPNVVIP